MPGPRPSTTCSSRPWLWGWVNYAFLSFLQIRGNEPSSCLGSRTPFSEANSIDVGPKAGRSLRLVHGSWRGKGGGAAAEGDTKSQKRKKQPLLHLLVQKRKPATALKASEFSAPKRMFLSLPLTRENMGHPSASAPSRSRGSSGLQWTQSPGGGQHLQGRGAPCKRGHQGLNMGHATPAEPSGLRRGRREEARSLWAVAGAGGGTRMYSMTLCTTGLLRFVSPGLCLFQRVSSKPSRLTTARSPAFPPVSQNKAPHPAWRTPPPPPETPALLQPAHSDRRSFVLPKGGAHPRI